MGMLSIDAGKIDGTSVGWVGVEDLTHGHASAEPLPFRELLDYRYNDTTRTRSGETAQLVRTRVLPSERNKETDLHASGWRSNVEASTSIECLLVAHVKRTPDELGGPE